MPAMPRRATLYAYYATFMPLFHAATTLITPFLPLFSFHFEFSFSDAIDDFHADDAAMLFFTFATLPLRRFLSFLSLRHYRQIFCHISLFRYVAAIFAFHAVIRFFADVFHTYAMLPLMRHADIAYMLLLLPPCCRHYASLIADMSPYSHRALLFSFTLDIDADIVALPRVTVIQKAIDAYYAADIIAVIPLRRDTPC